MENIIIKKSKSFAILVVFTFLAMSSLCYSQLVPEAREDKTEIRILQFESENGIQQSNQINETVNYPTDSPNSLQVDTIKGTPDEKIIKSNADPANKYDQIESIDSTKYNMFGDLLNDDPVYNKKYPFWIPVVEVLGLHALIGSVNMYVFSEDYAKVGFNAWSYNLKTGWEWDVDRFGMNFLAHPYSGALNFLSARSNGYNFWVSSLFAIGGSLVWEYFGENTLPAFNDIVNTPISGAAFGEVFYRLSSNLLDDRTTGAERFFREFGAALIAPTRFFNRLIQGKLGSVTTKEVYQKAPLNIELSVGVRKLNDGRDFWTGPQNIILTAQLDYGYAFEKREFKPFDYFTVRSEVNLGVGRKLLNSLTGYGILYGKDVHSGEFKTLIGVFQHYNYFDNKTFELGAIAFGAGIMTQYPFSDETFLFTNLHLGIVPLAGNSTRFGPDTSQLRDYNYGGGLETKIESGLNFGWASIQLIGYYFWIHTYVGYKGDNLIGIIKPRITIRLYKNLSIGFEQLAYFSDRFTHDFGNHHTVRTEQKIYLTLNVGNFKL